ncbi:MAG: PD-(D/E)XK nuclease family protein [Thermoplasmata archaeon]|nr:PD-(D/E)XK nuclease family protein [Thermoplasmata archaeon]
MAALGEFVGAALVLGGLAAVYFGMRAVVVGRRERRYGTLLAVDDGSDSAPVLRSSRYRISGRPDELRRLPDARVVPVEFKSRSTPARGVPYSHRVQVGAYCLLVEETTGRSPPYGVVRYGDGGEFRVPWDRVARADLLALRAEMDRPYDGRATPSPGRCARCPWRDGCDARAS